MSKTQLFIARAMFDLAVVQYPGKLIMLCQKARILRRSDPGEVNTVPSSQDGGTSRAFVHNMDIRKGISSLGKRSAHHVYRSIRFSATRPAQFYRKPPQGRH